MDDFAPVTAEELARAREDATFRHKLLADHLDLLLAMLNKVRAARNAQNAIYAQQIRDGIRLAVKLTDLIQTEAENGPPHAA
jgi:hypothetical protein